MIAALWRRLTRRAFVFRDLRDEPLPLLMVGQTYADPEPPEYPKPPILACHEPGRPKAVVRPIRRRAG